MVAKGVGDANGGTTWKILEREPELLGRSYGRKQLVRTRKVSTPYDDF